MGNGHGLRDNVFCCGADPKQDIIELQRLLDNLDARGLMVCKVLDDLMRARSQRTSFRTIDPFRRFSLIRQARRLWRQYALKSGSPKTDDALDTEILQTKYYLVRLKSQRKEVATELTRIKASVSACGRIPPEIWAIVFQFCLPDNEVYVRPNTRRAPLLLCRICRFWRNIALSIPYLWNSLSVNRSWRRKEDCFLLELWLQRSRSLPLCIEINISLYMDPTYVYHTLKLIVSHSERWHRVRLNLTDRLLRSVLSSRMPNLHILEFGSNYAIASLNLARQCAPNLHTVSLLTVPLDPAPLSLPWSQLTHFSSRCWADVQSHLEILKRCPKLEKCRIHLLHAQSPPFDAPLLMANLKSLEVVAFIDSAMVSIMNRLLLPSLSELSLIVPDESPACGFSSWPKLVVYSLIERSACGLVRVCLKGIEREVGGGCDTLTQKIIVVEDEVKASDAVSRLYIR